MASGEFWPMILHGDGPHGQGSPAMQNLVLQMTRWLDEDRASAEECRRHPWILHAVERPSTSEGSASSGRNTASSPGAGHASSSSGQDLHNSRAGGPTFARRVSVGFGGEKLALRLGKKYAPKSMRRAILMFVVDCLVVEVHKL